MGAETSKGVTVYEAVHEGLREFCLSTAPIDAAHLPASLSHWGKSWEQVSTRVVEENLGPQVAGEFIRHYSSVCARAGWRVIVVS